MIVCHCSVVSDASISRAMDTGAQTLATVCRSTGAGRDCGGCVFSVKRVMGQHPGPQTDPAPPASCTNLC